MVEIQDPSRCSIGLVYKVICNYRDFGQVRNPFNGRGGRPCTLTDQDISFLNALLKANPSLYLDEMQQKLFTIRGVHISIPTISWALIQWNKTNDGQGKLHWLSLLIMAVHHCLARCRVTCQFFKISQFSRNYAKHCNLWGPSDGLVPTAVDPAAISHCHTSPSFHTALSSMLQYYTTPLHLTTLHAIFICHEPNTPILRLFAYPNTNSSAQATSVIKRCIAELESAFVINCRCSKRRQYVGRVHFQWLSKGAPASEKNIQGRFFC